MNASDWVTQTIIQFDWPPEFSISFPYEPVLICVILPMRATHDRSNSYAPCGNDFAT